VNLLKARALARSAAEIAGAGPVAQPASVTAATSIPARTGWRILARGLLPGRRAGTGAIIACRVYVLASAAGAGGTAARTRRRAIVGAQPLLAAAAGTSGQA
jgi:hypothetical protein